MLHKPRGRFINGSTNSLNTVDEYIIIHQLGNLQM